MISESRVYLKFSFSFPLSCSFSWKKPLPFGNIFCEVELRLFQILHFEFRVEIQNVKSELYIIGIYRTHPVYSSRTLLSEAHIGAADNRVYIRARTNIDEYRCTCIFGCVFFFECIMYIRVGYSFR